MAGEIQLNGTTALTESSGAVTLNNVNSATNRTNLGLGTAATSASTDFVGVSTTITAGTGLSGGGDLSANRTINVSFSANDSNVKTAINASGSAPIYACRAWVNFDGVSINGASNNTACINEQANVSSISEISTGRYDININVALPLNEYAVTGSGARFAASASAFGPRIFHGRAKSTDPTNVVEIEIRDQNGTVQDAESISVAIFC